MRQKGFFDEADRLKKLSKLGDSLEKLNEHIDKNIVFRGSHNVNNEGKLHPKMNKIHEGKEPIRFFV